MSAQIVVDDGVNPPVNGSVDRDSTFLTVAFTLSNFDNTGILAHRWTLKDKPIGSSAALTSGTTPTTTITPDIAGTYLIELRTFLDVGATDLDDVDVEGIGVRFPGTFDHRVPAAGETSQFDPSRGWATAREEAIRDVQAFLASGGYLTETPIKIANYTALLGERVFYEPSGGTFTIFAPLLPVLGSHFGATNTDSDITSITLDGNGKNLKNPLAPGAAVASFTTGVLGGDFSADWVYDGTKWVII